MMIVKFTELVENNIHKNNWLFAYRFKKQNLIKMLKKKTNPL